MAVNGRPMTLAPRLQLGQRQALVMTPQLQQAIKLLQLSQLEQERTQRLVSTSAAARATLDQRNAELEAARATLAAAQAQLRDAELNLGFTHVTAPFRGRISDRRVDVGNLVNDQTLLTTIVQLDPIYLTFDMSEADFLAYQRAASPLMTRAQQLCEPSTTSRAWSESDLVVRAHFGWATFFQVLATRTGPSSRQRNATQATASSCSRSETCSAQSLRVSGYAETRCPNQIFM